MEYYTYLVHIVLELASYIYQMYK